MELKGWKPWELAALKASIVLGVFPAVFALSSIFVGARFSRGLWRILRQEGVVPFGFEVGVGAVGGVIIASFVTYRIWPRTGPEPQDTPSGAASQAPGDRRDAEEA